MEQNTLRAFEARCTQEEPPACQTMCPLHVEARAFCISMGDGKFAEARKILERTMPLAGLVGHLCQGDCLAHCRRAEVDAAVNLPLLEKACISLTRAARPMALPATGKKIAVAGAGLSSLVLAFELAKKGHSLTIFHTGPLGGRLAASDPGVLPENALPEALELLSGLRVSFEKVAGFDPARRDGILAEHLALYVGLDDPALTMADFALDGISDYLTQETAHPKIFAGGQLGGSAEFIPSGPAPRPSFVREAADGKRAAGSITRLMQGVSPATAREKEGLYPSALFTDISGIASAPPVVPADPSNPGEAEAVAEAARCIRCECLECVKRCVYLAHYKGYPKRYAREIYNNLSVVHGLRRTNSQINACAACGLCAAVCPNHADMGALCGEARREMVRTKRMPPSAHEFALEDMAFSNAPEVAFFRHQPGTSASAWAFFPGCQLAASAPGQTEAVYRHLCAHLPHSGRPGDGRQPGEGQQPGGVGFLLHCCGAPARWSGREQLTATSAGLLRGMWEKAGRPTLVAACASCLDFFTAELPDLPVISLWDALAHAPLPEGARPAGQTLALHDPCASRKTISARESVRAIVKGLGQDIEELALGRELTRCCGYGGLMDAANPPLGRAMAASRAKDSERDMLCWCIMCRDRLRAAGKASLHLLDLLFPAGEASASAARPAPGISERQHTRLLFRNRILHDLWHESPPKDSAMDSISLIIDEALAQKLEARRILHADIKAVILQAQTGGPQFENRASGRCLTSYRPRQVTFWVEYSQSPEGYVIHDAYCHRMVVPGTPGAGLATAATLEGYAEKGGRM